MAKRYLTTTLPYVNAEPHIGFALEVTQADTLARYWRLMGDEVLFNTGTDEHGQKILLKAQTRNLSPQEFVDKAVGVFQELVKHLELDWDRPEFIFTRTTDAHHVAAAQEFWRRCEKNGDIYKKLYKTKYCVGCELEKTDSELVDGKCPLHPNMELEIIEEENYFFRFSKYQESLLKLYDNPGFIVPEWRANEVRNFVASGLQDFSISRLKSKMGWGIEVPGDPKQVMYVWFDALVNYISALGWPENEKNFNTWWPGYQMAGKDNLRPQSAMWQAMLMSAGLEPSKQIFIHGFITSNGQKMSKSLGNIAHPYQLIEDYGADALRYYLLREIPPMEDGDYTSERFLEVYNAGLANGLGNLVSRVIKMAENFDAWPEADKLLSAAEMIKSDFFQEFRENMDNYQFSKALDFVWIQIKEADLYVQNVQPFKVFKDKPEEAREQVRFLLESLWRISVALTPILSGTALKIQKMIKREIPLEPLFLRR